MKKREVLLLFLIFFLILPGSAQGKGWGGKGNILGTGREALKKALKRAGNRFEGRRIDLVKDRAEGFLKQVMVFMREQVKYRRSIFGEEWEKEREELCQDLKKIWLRIKKGKQEEPSKQSR